MKIKNNERGHKKNHHNNNKFNFNDLIGLQHGKQHQSPVHSQHSGRNQHTHQWRSTTMLLINGHRGGLRNMVCANFAIKCMSMAETIVAQQMRVAKTVLWSVITKQCVIAHQLFVRTLMATTRDAPRANHLAREAC
jgi:predicted transcriptional regulator YheO